jgi:hypothetical protein
MEKMICTRLDFWAEKNRILSSTQYGFGKGRGTRDFSALLTTVISTSLDMKEQTVAAFLDVSGAYDNVFIDVLCSVMLDTELPERYDSYGTYCGARLLFFMLEASSVRLLQAIRDYHRDQF